MAITPSILINGLTPRPDGAEVDATFALGAAAIPLALASTIGVTSIEWSIVAKPTGSAVAIANATPATPFATTLGPLDVAGTYILKCVVNGDAASTKEASVAVLTANRAMRIPARGETSQWDGSGWWESAIRGLYNNVDAQAGTANIADGAVTSLKIANGAIMDVDVNAAAAIAGTKIAPDFGAQTIATTGYCTPGVMATSVSRITALGTETFEDRAKTLWCGESTSDRSKTTRWQAGVATTDAVATAVTLANYTPTVSSIVDATVTVLAIKSDDTAHWKQDVEACFFVDAAGVVTEMGANTATAAKTNGVTAGLAAIIETSGGIIRPKVTGRAAETFRWAVLVEYVQRRSAA
jgi:hypothetical protein